MFKLYAEKNWLTVREKEPITSGARNAYPVQFSFSPEWETLAQRAVFRAGGVETAVKLDGGVCTVPTELLSAPGHFLMVGVCGKSGDNVVLPTIWANLGMILEGAVPADDASPDVPDEPADSTTDHRELSHRDAPEQHPIGAIGGLLQELARIPEPVEALTNTELEEMLK